MGRPGYGSRGRVRLVERMGCEGISEGMLSRRIGAAMLDGTAGLLGGEGYARRSDQTVGVVKGYA